MRFKKYLLRQEKRTVTERVNYPGLGSELVKAGWVDQGKRY